MTEFIGQITVFIKACDAQAAEQRLRELAQQLEDGESDIQFADHNGDLQDAAAVEAECAASLPEPPNYLKPFDRYEIHGVRAYDKDTDPYHEQVPDADAEFWSLYGHIPFQGLECIGDFKMRAFAEEIYARITGHPFHTPDIATTRFSMTETALKPSRQRRKPPSRFDAAGSGSNQPHAPRTRDDR